MNSLLNNWSTKKLLYLRPSFKASSLSRESHKYSKPPASLIQWHFLSQTSNRTWSYPQKSVHIYPERLTFEDIAPHKKHPPPTKKISKKKKTPHIYPHGRYSSIFIYISFFLGGTKLRILRFSIVGTFTTSPRHPPSDRLKESPKTSGSKGVSCANRVEGLCFFRGKCHLPNCDDLSLYGCFQK